MVSAVILATAIWVCPGNVFSDVEKPGCQPFHEERGTVSTTPEPESGPATEPSSSPSDRSAGREPAPSQTNAEICSLYKEYIDLDLKTQGGFEMQSTDQAQRWQTLKRMFQSSPAPSCR